MMRELVSLWFLLNQRKHYKSHCPRRYACDKSVNSQQQIFKTWHIKSKQSMKITAQLEGKPAAYELEIS